LFSNIDTMEHVYPTPAVKHADNTKEMDVYKNIMSSGSGRGKLCIQVRATYRPSR